ncbi:MAG: hypothetical protein ABUS76_00135 [Candidatus Shikimatogenerans sp. Ttur]|uniref:Uncharacterized protein n=1 Tax=Candidatus Shikimatogenerans sp. Ttur TaxID=3158569 RepID=A0AAU7ZY79_9FLAO
MKILSNSNTLITKNLILIISIIYNNQKLKNILKSKLNFLKNIKIKKYNKEINNLLKIIKYIKKICIINLKNPFI